MARSSLHRTASPGTDTEAVRRWLPESPGCGNYCRKSGWIFNYIREMNCFTAAACLKSWRPGRPLRWRIPIMCLLNLIPRRIMIISGTVSEVEASEQAILDYVKNVLQYTVCTITRT